MGSRVCGLESRILDSELEALELRKKGRAYMYWLRVSARSLGGLGFGGPRMVVHCFISLNSQVGCSVVVVYCWLRCRGCVLFRQLELTP